MPTLSHRLTPARAQPALSLAARLLLAGVFLAAGWPKLMDPAGTVRSVRNFRLLPEALVPPVGYGLPVLELGLAVALLLGVGTRLAATLTAVAMLVFIGGISAAWARGLSIECGCFGGGGSVIADPVPGYVRDLIRDTGYLLVALALARWPRSRLSLDAALGGTPSSTPQE